MTVTAPALDLGDPLFYCGDSLQESKLARMRGEMDRAGLDALLFIKHDAVRWVTGFYAKGYRPFVELEYAAVLVKDGPVILGTSLAGEEQRIGSRARADQILPLGKHGNWAAALGAVFEAQGLTNARVGFDFLTYQLHAALTQRYPGMSLIDASALWTDVTKIKQPEEIELIRQALSLTQRAMQVSLDLVRGHQPVREIDVAAAAEFEMRRGGSEMTPFITIVASGPNAAIFQRIAAERVIQDGDMVLIDLGCVHRGYTGDFARTTVRGPASAGQKRLYRAAWLAEQEAIKAIRPGVPCSAIDRIAREVLAGEGYEQYTMPWAAGHQLGYGLHGAPVIGPGVEDLLMPGMVLNVEPAACTPDQPAIGGVEIEDTVLVTADGCERLTSFPYDEDLLSGPEGPRP
jgi:Xaa-Pro aminopeptidase